MSINDHGALDAYRKYARRDEESNSRRKEGEMDEKGEIIQEGRDNI